MPNARRVDACLHACAPPRAPTSSSSCSSPPPLPPPPLGRSEEGGWLAHTRVRSPRAPVCRCCCCCALGGATGPLRGAPCMDVWWWWRRWASEEEAPAPAPCVWPTPLLGPWAAITAGRGVPCAVFPSVNLQMARARSTCWSPRTQSMYVPARRVAGTVCERRAVKGHNAPTRKHAQAVPAQKVAGTVCERRAAKATTHPRTGSPQQPGSPALCPLASLRVSPASQHHTKATGPLNGDTGFSYGCIAAEGAHLL